MITILRNTKVATKLAAGFGLLTLLGLAIAVIGMLKMYTLSAIVDELATNRMVKVAQFTEIKDNFNANARAVRNIVIMDDKAARDGEKAKILNARRLNNELFAKLDRSIKQDAARALLKTLTDNAASYSDAVERVMQLATDGQHEAAASLLIGDVRRLQMVVFKATDESRLFQQNMADRLAVQAAETARMSSTAMLVLGTAMILSGIVVAFLITRDLLRALGAEPGTLSDIAGRVALGDLSVPLSVRAEYGASVMAAMARMQQSLTTVVSTVRAGSEGVATASAQIAEGNNDLSQRTEEQASALEETAASMEEMSSTVRQNAENTRQAKELAQSATEVAVRGGDMVAQVVDNMKHINHSSKRIADIIGVIDGIAFQTNILALNAAVEAARAGEQGRGFAVVATEVRNLAHRSAAAAKEIKDLISASVAGVEQGSALVDRAGATMGEVVESIRKVTHIIGEINLASSEQSQGVSQIGQAVQQMDQVTQENAALVEEMAAAATSLKSQSQDLLRTVAVFRLEAGDAAPAAAPAAPVMRPATPRIAHSAAGDRREWEGF